MLQATETADAVFATPALVLDTVSAVETRQEAWTVAVTLNESLEIAASTGLTARPDARMPKAMTGNVSLIGNALLPRQNNSK